MIMNQNFLMIIIVNRYMQVALLSNNNMNKHAHKYDIKFQILPMFQVQLHILYLLSSISKI